MTGTTFERARIFMHRNASPLDLARFDPLTARRGRKIRFFYGGDYAENHRKQD